METTAPQRPATADALIAAWATRDDLYARKNLAMSDEVVAATRAARKAEVMFLPPEERARAWASANSWYPPEHGQGVEPVMDRR